jgi:hypothetical protein
MDLNSEEFYKQKYLKYKHKYLEAQRLYGEELEGGGTLKWLIVPREVYDSIFLNFLKPGYKYVKDNGLYILAGENGKVIEPKGKSVKSYFTNKFEDTPAGIKENGLGVIDKKYSDDNAITQLKTAYPENVYLLIESNYLSSGGVIKKLVSE